jgi:hypothetical protein
MDPSDAHAAATWWFVLSFAVIVAGIAVALVAERLIDAARRPRATRTTDVTALTVLPRAVVYRGHR